MLQIYIYGPTEEGFLDIDPGTVLDMESLDEMFDENLSTGEFSMPVDFPWTPRNRRLMGFAERIENFSKTAKYWRCIVYDRGFPELPSAKLTMLEKNGMFSYAKGKFSSTISGSKGLFGSMVKNKKLKDLQLGGKITWSGKESRKFAEDLMKGQYPQYDHIAFAPVAIEDFIQKDRPDHTNEFLAKDTVNTVIAITPTPDGWVFGRPKSTDFSHTIPGEPEHIDYRTVPFLKLNYVLRRVFEENGYTVSGALLDTADFDDAYLFNQYAIENYSVSIFQDFNDFILPSNHVPDMLITDFLKGLFSLFNVYPTFQNINEVKLVYRESIFNNKKILSLNGIAGKEFTSTYQDSANEKGYKIAYTWDSNDNYVSDRVKDVADKTLVATVATLSALDALDIGRQLTTDDIAFVEADNMYYVIADAISTPLKWDVYSERLNEFVSGDGERSVDCNISTLCTYVEYNSTTGLSEKKNYVGCRQPGSYRNSKGVYVVNDFGLRIFYIRRVPILTIPYSSNHNRDYENNKVSPFSLALQGDDGLAKNLHIKWQTMRENEEIVKTTVRVNQRVLNDLKQHNCYEIDNVLYLPYKTEPSIPQKNMMEIELVPL